MDNNLPIVHTSGLFFMKKKTFGIDQCRKSSIYCDQVLLDPWKNTSILQLNLYLHDFTEVFP